MNRTTQALTGSIPYARALEGALPGAPIQREVWVHAALSRRQELRNAVQVCEWMVEPLAGDGGQSLTLVLSDGVSLSFLLNPEDVEDLSFALSPAQRGGRPSAPAP